MVGSREGARQALLPWLHSGHQPTAKCGDRAAGMGGLRDGEAPGRQPRGPVPLLSREKREELRALEDHRARGAFVRSRIRLLREMDRGSRFFYALEKTRRAKKHVTCLLAEDGTPLTDPEEMCGRARDFSPRIRPILALAGCSGRNSPRSVWATETDSSCLSPWPSSRKPSVACPAINLRAWTG
ncbi:unnamed protein product [Caretta caretta]